MNLIFSEIYSGMTAVGRVQSARDPLRSYLNELRNKNKLNSLEAAEGTCDQRRL